ncbi:hypothetical protein N0V94_007998 [Neodidymelliopsis sp. IMI 364377]|nr:hypothetical protein N0V94_007998 [Neodidymelliopsis sp. IMI 364377]
MSEPKSSPLKRKSQLLDPDPSPKRHAKSKHSQSLPFTSQSSSPTRKASTKSRKSAATSSTRPSRKSHTDSLLPSQILWASEASWLSATITGDTSQRELMELFEDDNLMAGAKVVYFVYNDINAANIETLLMTHVAMPTDSLLFSKVCDKYGRRRSKWAGDTMKFFERLVGRFVHECHENPRNAKQEFSTLSSDARQEFWMAQWEKDEAGLAKEMWSPAANVIDWESIYGTPPTSRTQEDRTKLEAV